MHEFLRQFKAAAVARDGTRPGRGGRYPDAMKTLALRYLVAASRQGLGIKAVAQDLAIDPATLLQWQRRDQVEHVVMQPVQLVDTPQRRGGGVTVHLPSGVALGGLDLDDALELVRRLA